MAEDVRPPAPLFLKDYPRDEWMDSADVCDVCGARRQVKVKKVHGDGLYGVVEIMERHNPGCPMRLEAYPNERSDQAGWEYASETVKLCGREFTPLKARGNVAPCLGCGKLIVGVPLILFLDEGLGGELDFCFNCALELGIIDKLRSAR